MVSIRIRYRRCTFNKKNNRKKQKCASKHFGEKCPRLSNNFSFYRRRFYWEIPVQIVKFLFAIKPDTKLFLVSIKKRRSFFFPTVHLQKISSFSNNRQVQIRYKNPSATTVTSESIWLLKSLERDDKLHFAMLSQSTLKSRYNEG